MYAHSNRTQDRGHVFHPDGFPLRTHSDTTASRENMAAQVSLIFSIYFRIVDKYIILAGCMQNNICVCHYCVLPVEPWHILWIITLNTSVGLPLLAHVLQFITTIIQFLFRSLRFWGPFMKMAFIQIFRNWESS